MSHEVRAYSFTEFLDLERLELDETGVSKLRVAHRGLRSLSLSDYNFDEVGPPMNLHFLQEVLICCKILAELEIIWFPIMLPYIPALLTTLPVLEALKIFLHEEDVKEAVLEHARICNVIIGNNEVTFQEPIASHIPDPDIDVEELTLRMPTLLRVDVEKSSLRVLKVTAREKGFVKYVGVKNGCKVIEMGL